MARKKKKGSDGSQGRLVLTFDEEKRRDYLTGFHKRKVERRKVALEEIRRKLKEEQRKLRDERHKEYLKMLKDREEALEEADELDQLVTSKTECVQYDHPNHTVTVTTVSDLDLSGARLLGLPPLGGEAETPAEEPIGALPKKSRNPFLSQRQEGVPLVPRRWPPPHGEGREQLGSGGVWTGQILVMLRLPRGLADL
ncbi:nucleolar protein 12 isoform X2 [Vombatus ursinus]|uniref:Nucleolar protein 12 n=1 Tax=Vombatus ursinus TaxID=29139 RepID=A0A4X2JYY0_VOMUR|nr:nucleolar protein 12 isoform X2 [Vombatus ursinus]